MLCSCVVWKAITGFACSLQALCLRMFVCTFCSLIGADFSASWYLCGAYSSHLRATWTRSSWPSQFPLRSLFPWLQKDSLALAKDPSPSCLCRGRWQEAVHCRHRQDDHKGLYSCFVKGASRQINDQLHNYDSVTLLFWSLSVESTADLRVMESPFISRVLHTNESLLENWRDNFHPILQRNWELGWLVEAQSI